MHMIYIYIHMIYIYISCIYIYISYVYIYIICIYNMIYIYIPFHCFSFDPKNLRGKLIIYQCV